LSNSANSTEYSGETDERIQVAQYLSNLTAAASSVPPAVLGSLDAVDQTDHVQVIALNCADESFPPGQDSFDSANSLSLKLQTSGLAFHLQTRAPLSSQLVELTARLEVALERLAQMDDKLGHAFHRIGYLEAQLAQREREIARFQSDQEKTVEAGQ
jgi:hypothetical protein